MPYAIDYNTREILAFVFVKRELKGENEAFIELKVLLEPFCITTFFTDGLSVTFANASSATTTFIMPGRWILMSETRNI